MHWDQGGTYFFQKLIVAVYLISISVIFSLSIFLLLSEIRLIFQSSLAQMIVTSVNVCALLFIIIAGGYLGFKTGWVGYELQSG